jgi:hypothetical protein
MYFPTYSVLNFYNEPDKILEFAESCTFYKEPNAGYPGVRTDCLSRINKNLFNYSCRKVISLIYGDRDNVSFAAENSFQAIKKEDLAHTKEGWVHEDRNVLTAIIYLSKYNNDAGTSIMKPKVEFYAPNEQITQQKKKIYSGEIKDVDVAEEAKNKNNENYEEMMRHNSEYNSMIAFDARLAHKANFDFDDNTTRMTQIIFFHDIRAPWYPIPSQRRVVA